MSPLIVVALLLFIAAIATFIRLRRLELVRAEYIRTYMFPPGLLDKLTLKRPGLEVKDRQLVARALRHYFLAHLKSGRQFVSMPSQVADDLWHEFILYTRHYDAFCRKAFGRFLHHTPAVVLGADRQNNTGLRRTWWYCCLEENINPRKATRLPLLFAIDAKLKIADGFQYLLDCKGVRREGEQAGATMYCGGDMSSSSFDGTTDGFGDASTGGSGDSSSASGDGGGGCGGGCGGGD